MKITNRIISLLLILCMLFAVCSCAKSDEEDSAIASDVVADNDESQNQDNVQQPSQDNTQSPSDNNSAQKPSTDSTQGNNSSVNDNGAQTPSEDKSPSADDTQTPAPDNSAASDSTDDNDSDDIDPYAPDAQFDTYVSNTYVPTGNHYALVSESETTKTFRGVFPVQQYGRLEYCFYISNCVDSTWGGGDVAYRNMPTESFEILSASVMITKNTGITSVGRKTAVTFDGGKKTRVVEADEMLWSDPVMFNVAEGEYLVFEWKVKYTMIPCNMVNGVGYGYESDNGSTFNKISKGLPMPSMIGAKRDGVKAVAFIGDSITAGEGAGEFNGYVAQISKGLGDKTSVWNLGLGYARANDAVNSPAWVKKAKGADTVAICFGVNDINSGVHDLGTRTANQIIDDIAVIAKEVADAGCEVIILTTPPYTYADASRVQKWKDVVSGLKSLAKTEKYQIFDFASYLGSSSDPSVPAFGGHPNGEGCSAVAKAFVEKVKNNEIKFK